MLNAGIVDKDVKAAKALRRRLHHRFDGMRTRHVRRGKEDRVCKFGFHRQARRVDRRAAAIKKYYAAPHQRLVDNPPWLFIVHDLNPRALSKKVKGFVSPQSWFVDLSLVSVD